MTLPIILLPELLLEKTWRLLRSFCRQTDNEGVVYWFGVEQGDSGVVTTLIVPDAETSRGRIRTSAAANAEVVEATIGTPLILLGQAHSHPGRMVQHSVTDDREAFASFPGMLSVVMPHYARGAPDLRKCGIHRILERRFVLLAREEVERHLRLLPSVRDLRHEPMMPERARP